MKDFMLALGGGSKPKAGAPAEDVSMDDGSGEEGQTAAAEDILSAIQAGDAAALSAALNAFIDMR